MPFGLPELVPVEVPLPCYALELNLRSPICQKCPHLVGCSNAMGMRQFRIPMREVKFNLLPPKMVKLNVEEDEDPELVYINALYAQCYRSVFDTKYTDSESPSSHAEEIAEQARRLKCSIRIYILACMIGYQQHRKDLVGAVAAGEKKFRVGHLLGKAAYQRAKNYAEVCRSEFGTFTAEAMTLLETQPTDLQDIEQELYTSEVAAARYIVRYKLNRLGKPEKSLYDQLEGDLSVNWLAIEESYRSVILKPYMEKHFGSAHIRRKRHAVIQTLGVLKRKPNLGKAMHLSRTIIMPRVLSRILSEHQLGVDDLEVSRDPITNAFEFWLELARAIAHLRCLKLYYGTEIFRHAD